MRIERITDISEILKCLPFEREIRKKGRDVMREADMLLFIESQINNPLFGFWISYDEEGKINGYVVAMISPFTGMERLILMRIYAKDKSILNAFIDIGKQWAKQYKIKKMTMTVSQGKDMKAFKRAYQFIPVSINMERRI
jgi:hypothetical protein